MSRIDRSTYSTGGERIETGLSITNGSKYDSHGKYSNGRSSGRVPTQHYTNGNGRNGYSQNSFEHRYAGTRYIEPENNKSWFLVYCNFNAQYRIFI